MRCLVVIALALVTLTSSVVMADLTVEQKGRLDEVQDSLAEIPKLLRSKKVTEAAEVIASAEAAAGELSTSGARGKELDALNRRIASAKRLVAARGKARPATKGKSPPLPPTVTTSFVRAVAPILVQKCSTCHIRESRGGFSVATLPAILRGSDTGVVFQAGKSEGSRLMELLRQGDMPRSGSPLSDAEQQIIAVWIDEGATFDGPDETTPLARLARPEGYVEPKALTVMPATSKDTVGFVADLAAVVVRECIGCHGGPNPAAQLNLTSFESLLRGSRDGPIVVPGKPDESLLVQKLRGTAPQGARMPLRRDPLPDELINRFANWVTEGARFDDKSPATELDTLLKIRAAEKMSHDELTLARLAQAKKNWELATAAAPPQVLEGDGFVILTNVSPARRDELLRLVARQRQEVARQLKIPSARPWLKGRLTLFVFQKRFDYSEFGKMVEQRDLPAAWRGHWKFDIVDAYACIVDGTADEPIEALVSEQFAGAYLDSLGTLPAWYSRGAARVVASRLNPRDPQVKVWDDELADSGGSGWSTDFLEARTLAGDSQASGYGFAKFLLAKTAKFQGMLSELRKGTAFPMALRKFYGADAKTLADAWARSVPAASR